MSTERSNITSGDYDALSLIELIRHGATVDLNLVLKAGKDHQYLIEEAIMNLAALKTIKSDPESLLAAATGGNS